MSLPHSHIFTHSQLPIHTSSFPPTHSHLILGCSSFVAGILLDASCCSVRNAICNICKGRNKKRHEGSVGY